MLAIVVRSLFSAVAAVSPLLSRAVFCRYFGAAVIINPGFLLPRPVSPLDFFGIVSEIAEHGSVNDPLCRPFVRCFPNLEARNLNSLLLIPFPSHGVPPYDSCRCWEVVHAVER